MGGKGKRRREKNYREAHGGESRLPPPPKLKELEAIPSKLRRIMELQNNSPLPTNQLGPSRNVKVGQDEQKKGGSMNGREKDQKDICSVIDIGFELGNNIEETTPAIDKEENDALLEKKKRKKKRKAISDLRFQNMDPSVNCSTRRKRKKEFLEARKKKHKKAKVDDFRDFPGHEVIKFGDVVDAPPKLSFPKVSKTAHDASHERIRLQAVEAYRSRKGWVSRPGIHLPAITEAPSS